MELQVQVLKILVQCCQIWVHVQEVLEIVSSGNLGSSGERTNTRISSTSAGTSSARAEHSGKSP